MVEIQNKGKDLQFKRPRAKRIVYVRLYTITESCDRGGKLRVFKTKFQGDAQKRE